MAPFILLLSGPEYLVQLEDLRHLKANAVQNYQELTLSKLLRLNLYVSALYFMAQCAPFFGKVC